MAAAAIVATLVGCFGGQQAQPTAPPAASPSPATSPSPQVANGALPALREVVAKVSPAVVGVDVNSTALDFFLRPIEQHSAGSGVIIRPDGYVVTNDHVIAGAGSIQVSLADNRVIEAQVVGRDARSDLAVLKLEATDLPHLALAPRDSVDVGDWVVAFGNALGLEGGPTVTVGIVSALGRTVRTSSGTTLADLIQTDAAINEGNSGGPLVNLKGELVGINTTILAEAQGIGFAINSETVERFANDLIEFGRVRLPLIGLQGRTLRPAAAEQLGLKTSSGVLVTAVAEGPARQAGIQPQDVIIRFASQGISSWDQFLGILWSRRPGETVEAEIVRASDNLKLQVVLGERPADGR
ncbi:MAG: trypsin-like peptidase domain-containing protein [Chloroflexi bacterium]|nr:trypsin-like peptidase domain-containing protein [Chloroflexota bacterium]